MTRLSRCALVVVNAGILASILLGVVAACEAIAADIRYVDSGTTIESKKLKNLLIEGDIIQGDFAKLLRLISKNRGEYLSTSTVELTSNGGDLLEAIKIGGLLKNTYKAVTVDSVCASSCFFIYVSAVNRSLGDEGKLGIHRPYFMRNQFKNLTPKKAEQKQNKMMVETRKFLTDNNVPQSLIDKMYMMSSDEIHWLTSSELDSLGKKSIWYEEYLAAKCNYKKQNRIQQGEDGSFTIQAEEINTWACEEGFTKPEATRYLNETIKK